MTELDPHQKDAIGRVARLHEDIQRFRQSWPALNTPPDQTPPFTWGQLERQLCSLSATPDSAAMVRDLVTATRKQAPFKPAEMVLREILCIASAVMDETFPSSASEASSPYTEEGPMR